ncbi:hypothetical protein Lpp123_18008 [Lacticaseibacillus paracasei subsp. paracasei Lpp123]|uniref:Uncharacterized protein n=1 Tax=Lacticaseibacillus paracasei subsp. paracasei Lpp123 TaxID=1256201 RepID=A0A829GEY3_LACPA|nr:hypothetical protein Lpp123_18008 [Lacticaseibacillus paracasei subsp. paracasei Lpp123]
MPQRLRFRKGQLLHQQQQLASLGTEFGLALDREIVLSADHFLCGSDDKFHASETHFLRAEIKRSCLNNKMG